MRHSVITRKPNRRSDLGGALWYARCPIDSSRTCCPGQAKEKRRRDKRSSVTHGLDSRERRFASRSRHLHRHCSTIRCDYALRNPRSHLETDRSVAYFVSNLRPGPHPRLDARPGGAGGIGTHCDVYTTHKKSQLFALDSARFLSVGRPRCVSDAAMQCGRRRGACWGEARVRGVEGERGGAAGVQAGVKLIRRAWDRGSERAGGEGRRRRMQTPRAYPSFRRRRYIVRGCGLMTGSASPKTALPTRDLTAARRLAKGSPEFRHRDRQAAVGLDRRSRAGFGPSRFPGARFVRFSLKPLCCSLSALACGADLRHESARQCSLS